MSEMEHSSPTNLKEKEKSGQATSSTCTALVIMGGFSVLEMYQVQPKAKRTNQRCLPHFFFAPVHNELVFPSFFFLKPFMNMMITCCDTCVPL